jgi:hypothetical protein
MEVPMKTISSVIMPGFVVLAAIGAALSSTHADTAASASQGPLSCEIQKSASRAGIALAAVVHAAAPVSGVYSFHVVGGGGGNSSNIDQGGPFNADPSAPVTLGNVMLSGSASYNATLTVTAAGSTVSCTDKTGTF